MSLQSRAVAESLSVLSEKVHDAKLIDTAQSCGKIATQDLVMTSMGNARRAVITPYYPAFQMEYSLFDRLVWAAIQQRPFVEASLHMRTHSDGSPKAANVVLRLCEAPMLDTMAVMETGYSYPLDSAFQYGTMERVVDDICARTSDKGTPLPGRTGWVETSANRGEHGKWGISRVEHVTEPYVAEDIPQHIHKVVSKKLDFVDNPAFPNGL